MVNMLSKLEKDRSFSAFSKKIKKPIRPSLLSGLHFGYLLDGKISKKVGDSLRRADQAHLF